MKKVNVVILTVALLLGAAGQTWAAPWPMYRDAIGTGHTDGYIPKPTDRMIYSKRMVNEYDFGHGRPTWPEWADQEIKEAISWDLMKGYPDGKDWVGRKMYRFNAEKEITRAEFVTILNRALAYDEAPGEAPKGEPVPDWAKGHLGMLMKKGIVAKDGRFDANRPATRREIAVWVGRAVKAENLPLTASASAFPDFQPGDDGYDDALRAIRAGLMRGYDDGTFHPDATFTRAQAAAVVVRLAKSLPPGDWTMTADDFIRWWEMFTIAGKARWPNSPSDQVYLDWMTPEVIDEMRGEMRDYTGVNTGIYWDDAQMRWEPYSSTNGAAALRVPGSPKGVARVATRSVMAYDIGYIPIGPVGSADSSCWRAGYPKVFRIYLRRFPYGLRITDTEALQNKQSVKFAPWLKDDGVDEWWSLPSWYEGNWAALYERLPDGTFRKVGPYDGPGEGACAGVDLPKP